MRAQLAGDAGLSHDRKFVLADTGRPPGEDTALQGYNSGASELVVGEPQLVNASASVRVWGRRHARLAALARCTQLPRTPSTHTRITPCVNAIQRPYGYWPVHGSRCPILSIHALQHPAGRGAASMPKASHVGCVAAAALPCRVQAK